MSLSHLEFLKPNEGFLGIAPNEAPETPDDANAIIVPYGLEVTVSHGKGVAKGPAAILEASHQLEGFDDEHWSEPFRTIGIATVRPRPINTDLEGALEQLEEIIDILLKAEKFPLTLGGEHALTAAAIRPFAEKYPDLTILHFGAHARLRDGYEGHHFSHASAMRRCLDNPSIGLVSCGIRSISAEEVPFLESQADRIKIFWARDRAEWDMEEILDTLKGRSVYISFALGAFDTGIMPSTGTPEPGGLSWDDAMEIIRETSRTSTIVGADIVELSPIEHVTAPDFTAAKLAYKILGYAFSNNY
jgi:agmatinase